MKTGTELDRQELSPEGPSVSTSAPPFRGKLRDLLLGCLLAFVTIAAYAPVRHFGFVDIDDGLYVYDNLHVLAPFSLSSVQWAFIHSYGDNYAPLDFLAHQLNVRLFGLNAPLHHDVNLTLHVICVIALFWVLRRATGSSGRSFMVAALCALHPINVENVAWVAEQKTMLSTIFFLLALGAYRWYSLTPKWTRMAVVTALFAIALLCKPQIVTFPFVLLLWDWWPLGRLRLASASSDRIEAGGIAPRSFGALLLEKVPLFLAAFAGSLLTMYAQRGMQRVLVLPVYIRLGNAILSYAKFLGKAFWPEGFALMYLHPGYGLSWLQVSAALVFLLAVTALVLKNWRHPYLITGWFWFIGTMIPTIGLVQVDYQALADRYAYVSFMGLFILVCWGISDLAQSRHLPRPVLPAVSLTILLVLAALTYRQAGFWSDKFTLWNHTLAVTHRNWVADYRLAAAYVDAGNDARALEYYYQAAQDRPHEPIVNVQIALIEHKRGNLKQAIEYYRRALRYSNDPTINSQVLANLGHIYGEQGDQAKAKACFQQSLRITAHPIPGPCTN